MVDTDKETRDKQLRIIKSLKKLNVSGNEFSKDKNFETFIYPCASYYNDMNICDKDYDEGFIEYLDSDELNNSMIAINYHELYKGMKGTSCPPLYTHCEIHPSVMNGILGVNIPFSDHNQSPRNCYQCLNENEKVLMSSGKYKKIKDIKIGDEVVCFNPENKIFEYTSVINNYNRITGKLVNKLSMRQI